MLPAMVRDLGHEMLDNRQKYKPDIISNKCKQLFVLLTYCKGKAIPHHPL